MGESPVSCTKVYCLQGKALKPKQIKSYPKLQVAPITPDQLLTSSLLLIFSKFLKPEAQKYSF